MAKLTPEYSREWRKRNPGRAAEHSRKWHANNRDAEKAYREKKKARRNELTKQWKRDNPERVALSERKSWLKARYGITLEQYEEMSVAQDHKCALCTKHRSNEKTGNLTVDHCHDSGVIRGLLCNDCNRNLISHRTDPQIFLKAAEYVSAKREKVA